MMIQSFGSNTIEEILKCDEKNVTQFIISQPSTVVKNCKQSSTVLRHNVHFRHD